MATGDAWIVDKTNVYIRSGPGFNNSTIGALQQGTEIVELTSKKVDEDIWINHSKGWTNSKHLIKKNKYEQQITSPEQKKKNKAIKYITESIMPKKPIRRAPQNQGNVETITTNSPATQSTSTYEPESFYTGSKGDIDSGGSYSKINNVLGCFGLPYQFLPVADPRCDTGSADEEDYESVGFEYASKVVDRMPIILIAPGRVDFMKNESAANQRNVIERLIQYGTGGSDYIGMGELSSKNMRYFEFAAARSEYFSYVNPMCAIAARYMGLSQYDSLNWESITQTGSGIRDIGTMSCIPFYIDSDTSVGESFGNSTTQSMLASTVNSISDMGRELSFLLGGTGTLESMDSILNNEEVKASMQNVNDLVSKLLNGRNNSFLSNIGSHLTTVAAGGKLIFPEIWSDSSFSKNYSVNLKLISPDPDNASVFLNVIAPLMHLIALVGPKQATDNVNGYVSPFLVRAVYKGFFNIDMGIITSMTVTKGAECQWTKDGIPTSVEVSFEIKDLYPTMSITPSVLGGNVWTTGNTSLMDYIANLCGVNPYDIDIGRAVDMWYTTHIKNAVSNGFSLGIWANIKDGFGNAINNIFNK